MCGRYTLRSSATKVADEFELPVLPPYVPRWNISPTQMVPAIRMEGGKPVFANLRWGLIPFWATDLSMVHAGAH